MNPKSEKYIVIKVSVIFMVLFFISVLFSCEKDKADKREASITILENTISEETLSANGGMVTFQVESEYALLKTAAGRATEGNQFITSVTPDYAGSAESAQTTEIKVYSV